MESERHATIVILNPSASLSEESESDKINVSMSDRINSSEESGEVSWSVARPAKPRYGFFVGNS